MNKKADRPDVIEGRTYCIPTGCGKVYVIINRLEGQIFEVFLKGGKAGGCMTAQTETIGRLISDRARYGIEINDKFVKSFKGTSCHQALEKGHAQSCTDVVARAIELDIALHVESEPKQEEIK